MIKAEKVTWILVGIIGIILLINVYYTTAINGIANSAASQAEENARAADIQITVISDASCTDCFDPKITIDTVRKANVKINSENDLDYSDATAQVLIDKYNLQYIPAVIITGEIAKNGSTITGGVKADDALIFDTPNPVYLDLSTGKYRGRVQAKLITNSDCTDCYDLSTFITTLEKLMSITSTTEELSDASEDIKKYDFSEVPAIIFSGDLDLYPETLAKLEALGRYVGTDLVLTAKVNPPYWNIKDNEAKGLVTVTYVTDDSCSDCYNVQVHKTILENYGVFIANKSTVDISSIEGQSLISKYSITKVPTIIVSSDLQYYQAIIKVWTQVGTVEDDGNYIFRNVSLVSANYTELN